MSDLSELKRAIMNIANSGGDASNLIFEAEVKSVDDETITAEYDGMVLEDIRTCASIDGDDDYLHIYPKVGSTVLLIDMGGGSKRDLAVIAYSAIDKVSIHGGEQTMVNGTELKKQLDVLSNRVQMIYDGIANGTPSETETAFVTLKGYTTGVKSEDFSNIEDETLLH